MKNYILPLFLSPFICFGATTNLDIYTNSAFITKTTTLEKSGDVTLQVPAYTTLLDIRFSLQKGCEISNPELSKKLELETKDSLHVKNLLEEKSKILNEINALKAKEELLKTLSLKNEFDVKKIEKISSYLTTNLIKNQNEINMQEKRLKEIEKILQESVTLDKEYKNLHVSYQCQSDKSKLQISYALKELSFTPFYEIYANDTQANIKLKYRAKISQNGLEDLKNIDMHIYSYALNKEVNPQVFYPRYIYKKPETLYKESVAAIMPRALMKNSDTLIEQREITLEELGTKYVYSIKDVTLELNKELLIDINTEQIDAKYTSYIDGYGTNKAYLEAEFLTKYEYQSAPVKLFLNAMPISQYTMPPIKKESPTKLYFGENQFLHVNKELIKTESQKTLFGGSEVDTQKWKYTLTNRAKKTLHVSFVQSVPVSKDGDVTVKTIAEPNYTSQSAEGKTSWEFELKTDETKEIIFGYEITKKE